MNPLYPNVRPILPIDTMSDNTKRVIYLIGSLRNPKIPHIASVLRQQPNVKEVFASWFAAGEIADDRWRDYEMGRGLSYKEALKDWAAQHVLNFDRKHLDRCDLAILVLPAGRSGHLELGYVLGQGKPGYVLFDEQPPRWDVMYGLATDVFFSLEDLIGTRI